MWDVSHDLPTAFPDHAYALQVKSLTTQTLTKHNTHGAPIILPHSHKTQICAHHTHIHTHLARTEPQSGFSATHDGTLCILRLRLATQIMDDQGTFKPKTDNKTGYPIAAVAPTTGHRLSRHNKNRLPLPTTGHGLPNQTKPNQALQSCHNFGMHCA